MKIEKTYRENVKLEKCRCIKVRMLLQFPESRVANHLRTGKELLPAYVTAFELYH